MELNPGDIIYVDRGTYKHYGIYSGDGKVIHYTKNGRDGFCDGTIEETPLEPFVRDNILYRIPFPHVECAPRQDKADTDGGEPAPSSNGFFELLQEEWKLALQSGSGDLRIFSPQQTVERARSKIGVKNYNVLFSNCEHFAIWCKTGLLESTQVEQPIQFLGSASNFLGSKFLRKLFHRN